MSVRELKTVPQQETEKILRELLEAATRGEVVGALVVYWVQGDPEPTYHIARAGHQTFLEQLGALAMLQAHQVSAMRDT